MRTLAVALAILLGAQASVMAQSADEAVAMLLFGHPDPANVTGYGISGLGNAVEPIKITQLERCKYRVSDQRGFEEIDFNLVAEIRHSIVPSYPDKLKLILDGKSAEEAAREAGKVVLVQVMGTKTAVCGKTECTAKRAFSFIDTDQIDRAKRAARFLRTSICKGRAF